MSERRARVAGRPGRSRSQHFLRSQGLAAGLGRDAGVRPDELVLDLGAGSGRLTAELARAARHVWAVELDARWRRASAGGGGPTWTSSAATPPRSRSPASRSAWSRACRSTGRPAILRHLLDDPGVSLTRADVIVEWRVAMKRALPWPSTGNDVLLGAWYEVSLSRRLPCWCFDPVPAVDTGVLTFRRRAARSSNPNAVAAHRPFVAAGFRNPQRLRREPRDLDAHQGAELFARRYCS